MTETTDGVEQVVDELAALPLRTITERLCGLEATLVAGGAIGTALRQAALRKMTAHWRAEHVAPTGRAAGLGTVSLTLPQQKLVVDDPDAFASWLAERHPSEVEATITLSVPASSLPAILASIETELLTPEIAEALDERLPDDLTEDERAVIELARALRDRQVLVRARPVFTKALLDGGLTVIPAGVDAEGVGYPAAVFGEDGSVVPGVTVVPGADPLAVDDEGRPVGPQPTSISVRLEAEAKARAVAAAASQFRALLAGQPAVLAVDGSLAGGNSLPEICPSCSEIVHDSDCELVGDGRPVEAAREPEEALAEPSYDDEDGIADDAPAIDVLGLAAWRGMRKPALQAECRRLSLDDTGTVADLRGRLGDWAASTAGMPA